MSGHKPWSEISAKLRADPERRARIEQREQAIEAELNHLLSLEEDKKKSNHQYYSDSNHDDKTATIAPSFDPGGSRHGPHINQESQVVEKNGKYRSFFEAKDR